MRKNLLTVGEPAPWFVARAPINPKFHFDSVGGHYVVLCFFESAAISRNRQILDDFLRSRDRFDDVNVCFFGVSTDPEDERSGRVQEQLPGIHIFWDFDKNASQLYGAAATDPTAGTAGSIGSYRPHTLVLDTLLRVVAVFPFEDGPETHVPRVLDVLDRLPPIGPPTLATVQAPILVVPRIFEPGLCRNLIELYEQHGGYDSGFMRDVNGKTTGIIDCGHKRRRDYDIEDEEVRRACMVRIHDRLAPEIHKAFQFRATRMERYIVACYDGGEGGHFRAHRDNTTKGTAHRRFAVSLFLNTGEFEGGYVRFPEFGPQLYIASVGGAVVFSCSLLHEATLVTRGRRYMFLPFLYDDEAARIREQNRQFLSDTDTEKGETAK